MSGPEYPATWRAARRQADQVYGRLVVQLTAVPATSVTFRGGLVYASDLEHSMAGAALSELLAVLEDRRRDGTGERAR